MVQWGPQDSPLKEVFGMNPWAAVEMPAWFHLKPQKRYVFEPMKIRIGSDMTWMRNRLRRLRR